MLPKSWTRKGNCTTNTFVYNKFANDDISAVSAESLDPFAAQPLQKACRTEFTWKADGSPNTVVDFSANGVQLDKLQFPSNSDPASSVAYYSDADGIAKSRFKSGAAIMKTVFYITGQAAGLPRSVRYFDLQNKPQPDADGSYGERFEYDSRGVAVTLVNVGPEGEPTPLPNGAVKLRLSYSASYLPEEMKGFRFARQSC